uniref:Uncharacterized protein n=1 Tax=Siphoviridae sp. ctKwY15 TaxID=2827843 RepID=A0A8S5SU28_9CAUD|nr:MAG TPA: hypothetical protein [Siphoviridae sp. ctKwY15]
MKKIKYGKFKFGDGTFLNYTPCPYNMPGYHGNFAVGSADCQHNCSCFVEINKEKKYVVCNPSECNLNVMKKRLDKFKALMFGV